MAAAEDVIISRYRVSGMSCLRDARSAIDELSTITGVTDVDVNLASGEVRVTASTPLDPDEVLEAIGEAGYEIVA